MGALLLSLLTFLISPVLADECLVSERIKDIVFMLGAKDNIGWAPHPDGSYHHDLGYRFSTVDAYEIARRLRLKGYKVNVGWREQTGHYLHIYIDHGRQVHPNVKEY